MNRLLEHYGIATTYNGRVYRSRLEARWAAMFDLLGWQYEYEPYDLPGWIPDFLIHGHQEILVEVKPFVELDQFDEAKITTAMERGGKHGTEVLLLGCTIESATYWPDHARLGWLGEVAWDHRGEMLGLFFEEAPFNHFKDRWGFFHSSGSYSDRITGIYDGDGAIRAPDFSQVLELWHGAANRVQWRRDR
jgi:hypothetical protein